jgi:transposase
VTKKSVPAKRVQQSKSKPAVPDFLARLKKIYRKKMKVTGAEIIARDRDGF